MSETRIPSIDELIENDSPAESTFLTPDPSAAKESPATQVLEEAAAIVREKEQGVEKNQWLVDQLDNRVQELRDLISKTQLPFFFGDADVENDQLTIDVNRATEKKIGHTDLLVLESVDQRQFYQTLDREFAASQDQRRQADLLRLRLKYDALNEFLHPRDPLARRTLYARLRQEFGEIDDTTDQHVSKRVFRPSDILAIANGVLEPLWRKRE